MKHWVLFVCTHPVQYAAPMFRRMAHDHRLEILVAYCSLEGAETYLDGEFGVSFASCSALAIAPFMPSVPGVRTNLAPSIASNVRRSNDIVSGIVRIS